MGMTMSQKILASHAGLKEVHAGQLVMADLDLVLGNDITTAPAVSQFPKFGHLAVFDKDKIALVPDHFAPNKDIKAATQCKCMREFAYAQRITHYWETGRAGVEHALLPEQGLTNAGDLIIGADSHTCTYGAVGAFSTGVGSTDMACGMATGRDWFKVPAWRVQALCVRQGFDPFHHRHDRCGRGAVPEHGIHWGRSGQSDDG